MYMAMVAKAAERIGTLSTLLRAGAEVYRSS
jgi:hypothetical protein